VSVPARLAELFHETFGVAPAAVLPLESHGSNRLRFRLVGPNHRTAIGVFGPDRNENRAFLAFARAFRAIGLPVPEVYRADEGHRVYLEEDLGDTTLFEALEAARRAAPQEPFPAALRPVYERVLAWLPRFQIEGHHVVDYRLAYPRAAFDCQSILWDLNYFKYHFLKLAYIPFHEARLERDFRELARFLLAAERDFFLYRDFQSRNVMLRDGAPWFIDFQGGRRGALQYDVASLLYDAKAALPPAVREELLVFYLNELARHRPVDREAFVAFYRGYVLVRIFQAMGAYGYRGFFERKVRFLQSVPPAIDNLDHLLRHDLWPPVRLPELRAVVERICQQETLRRRPVAVPAGLTVTITSFSFRRGYPEDATGHGGGFVFDLRALHNPGRYAEFADLSGRDAPVARFLHRRPEVRRVWRHVRALVTFQVEEYLRRGFTSLSVAFGCTGGQHRSVFFAETLARYLRRRFPGVHVELVHREQAQWAQPTARAAGEPSPS